MLGEVKNSERVRHTETSISVRLDRKFEFGSSSSINACCAQFAIINLMRVTMKGKISVNCVARN